MRGRKPERRLASAKEYLQKKDTKAAVIEIKNALQANPDLGEARYLLGTALLQEGNAVAAEVEFRKALAANFPADVVIPELARSMLMLGQAKKLVDEFGEQALRQAAGRCQPADHAGRCLWRVGQAGPGPGRAGRGAGRRP